MTKLVGEVNTNITSIELENGISAGIRWRSLGTDMVPIFEEYQARTERGITVQKWFEMEPMERAIIIAVRRITTASHNHQAEAEIRESKKNAGKK